MTHQQNSQNIRVLKTVIILIRQNYLCIPNDPNVNIISSDLEKHFPPIPTK